jgi:hypothetical protein
LPLTVSLLYTPFSVTRLLPSLLLPLPGSLLYTHSLDGAARRQVSFSGGRLDSHEFARKWRERFPEEPLNASLAALGRRLTVASVLRDSPRFQVPHPRRVQLVREGGTSRVHLVREGRGGGGPARLPALPGAAPRAPAHRHGGGAGRRAEGTAGVSAAPAGGRRIPQGRSRGGPWGNRHGRRAGTVCSDSGARACAVADVRRRRGR